MYNSVVHHWVFTTRSQIYFCHHIFDNFYPLLPHPSPFPSGNHHSALIIYEFLFVHLLLSVLYPTSEWSHMVFDFFHYKVFFILKIPWFKTVLSNMVATSHMWLQINTWNALRYTVCVKYTLDFEDLGKRNINYPIKYFLLITCWNDNILDILC